MNGSRRKALCALGAGVLGPWAGAGALAHQGDQVDEPTPEELTEQLARALARRHGGRWHCDIGAAGRHVMIFKLPDRST